MTIEDVKTYLALYDEAYSYQEIAIKTGYPVSQLRELYDEIFYAKEIGKRRRSMQRMNAMKGVYRVHPVTFEVTKFNSLKELKDLQYNVSNIFYSCRNPQSLCRGYLWRFGIDVDPNDVVGGIKQANPEIFIPVRSENPVTGEIHHFDTIQVAFYTGYNKRCILEVIEGKKKMYKGLKWYLDTNGGESDCTKRKQ